MDLSDDAVAILQAFAEPAIILSRDYAILAANDAYRERYGFSDRESTGRHCYEVSHHNTVPCDLAGETCPLKACLATRQRARVLHIHHTPRGEEYVNVETWPILDRQTGEVAFLIERMTPSDAGSTEAGDGLLIGKSDAFLAMLNQVERVAGSETTVLLLGESGTGKEMVAQTVHRLSERRDGPFVPVECTGLPETLFEAELFGHERGAFTGAESAREGLVAAAAGGTLFLDEIGDIPLAEQVKLLRLLETRRYRPVGSTEWRDVDFRLVCATNHNLSELVAEGRFRADLYYRLSVFEIELPPLRERTDDLELLVNHLLERLDAPHRHFSTAALSALAGYDFPGNIRELRNIVERAVLLADADAIGPEHLPKHCLGAATAPAEGRLMTLEEAETAYLRRVLRAFEGDRRALADALGVSERVLYRKLAALRDTP